MNIGSRLRALIAAAADYFLFTSSGALLGLLGASSQTALLWMLFCGMALDAVRAVCRNAIDLRGRRLREAVVAYANAPPPLRWWEPWSTGVGVAFPLFLFGTTALYVIAGEIYGEESLARALGMIAPVESLAAAAFPLIRNHVKDLVAHGFEHRAVIVGHAFSAGFFIFLFACLVGSIRDSVLGASRIWRNQRKRSEQTSKSGASVSRMFAALMVLFLGFWVFLSFVLSVTWKPGGRQWNPQISNNPLFLVDAFYVCCRMFFQGISNVTVFLHATTQCADRPRLLPISAKGEEQ